ncbi:MAG: magnesium chelatase, partial [Myxococcota bacterium]
YQVQIRTHYPETRALEIQVMEQERKCMDHSARQPYVPGFMRDIVAEVTLQARQSPDVNQTSGVSVRASISSLETLIAASERRALRLEEEEAVPRISDLNALAASVTGKLEFEYAGNDQPEEEIVEKLVRRAVKIVFDERFRLEDLEPVVQAFQEGWKVEVGDQLLSLEYLEGLDQIEGLRDAIRQLSEESTPARTASAVEFILEGLHLSNRLNKEVEGHKVLYR